MSKIPCAILAGLEVVGLLAIVIAEVLTPRRSYINPDIDAMMRARHCCEPTPTGSWVHVTMRPDRPWWSYMSPEMIAKHIEVTHRGSHAYCKDTKNCPCTCCYCS